MKSLSKSCGGYFYTSAKYLHKQFMVLKVMSGPVKVYHRHLRQFNKYLEILLLAPSAHAAAWLIKQ